MAKVDLKQLVVDFGPCVSSELAEKIRLFHPTMSPEAIRKMISRSDDIAKLPYIRFSHNRRFIYSKKEFGSFRFWNRLKFSLLKNNSVYSHAILSVINNGGCVRKRDFGIVCGSPIKQLNHLSYSNVLDNLLQSKLFRLINVEGVGDCVVINNNSSNDSSLKESAKCESFFERPIVELIKSWVRNIGLISYNQVKTKYDDDNPVVGSFEWGMTAPSYAYPLAEYVDGALIPGFVACDFHLDFERDSVNESAADIFLRKVEMTRVSRKNHRIMFVMFARKFSSSAFKKLRGNGVLAITTGNAFGHKVDSGIDKLSDVVRGALSIDRNPEQLIKMVDDFESIAGENGNLRGYLFELFVSSQAQNIFGVGLVSMNREYKHNGEAAEVDVVFENDDEIVFIECKNRNILTSTEVTDWIRKRIRIVNSYYKDKVKTDKKICHYLWVTGRIKESDIMKIDEFKSQNKKQYIDYKYSEGLREVFAQKYSILKLYERVIAPVR